MSDTKELPFLDPVPVPVSRKRTMKMKHVDNSKKMVEWKNDNQEPDPKHPEEDKHPEQSDAEDPVSLRQCLGPGCVYPARPGSKYCSDDCGMKLAADRIYMILPPRIQQWQNSPCVAEEYGKKMLERIHSEQQDTRTRLRDMERRYHELEAIILHGKQQPVCMDEESYKIDRDSADLQIFCVSCGKPISMRVALRHMERCFTKTKKYCKRLQVLCPLHSRDPKVPNDEVCGCPLVHNVFESTGDFCRLPKRLCNHHYCWEKLRRAEVDLERVRVLEVLLEQEHKVRTAMMNRAGLLALMLHQTIQHDPLTTDLRSRADN
ncbi:CXXC-type zinc finger protein 1-like [Tupaia chinensis]|uniref:CXXC-type zinc finger protein 1-like n=1 Tax=Tupaia chinensis TaxID=246437 RepID=UPI000FFB0A83|nr:CXXC-type zinc finger protein 1-like [Tupaia chinensis]